MRDIRATRDRLGLSTAELARLVGVENRTAHGWLAGRPVPEPVWRFLERELDVKQFAQMIVSGNPFDAIGGFYGIERKPNETDAALKCRIDQVVLTLTLNRRPP